MPHIGSADRELIWPAWSNVEDRWKVPQWPNANTGRVDPRLRNTTMFDIEPLASRCVMRLTWQDFPPGPLHWQWFWSDVQIEPSGQLIFDGGTSPGGASAKWFVDFDVPMVLFPGDRGIRFQCEMTPPGALVRGRVVEWPTNEVSPVLVHQGILHIDEPASHLEEPPFGTAYPGAWPFINLSWQPLSEKFPAQQLTTEP